MAGREGTGWTGVGVADACHRSIGIEPSDAHDGIIELGEHFAIQHNLSYTVCAFIKMHMSHPAASLSSRDPAKGIPFPIQRYSFHQELAHRVYARSSALAERKEPTSFVLAMLHRAGYSVGRSTGHYSNHFH